MVKKRSDKGLIVYNIDKDELAFLVGQALENNPSEDIIVKKYEGPKDFPRLKITKEEFERLDYVEQGKLVGKSVKYYRRFTRPILKEIVKEINPNFYLELHSTPDLLFYGRYTWFKTQYIWTETYPYPSNKKLRTILHNYPIHQEKLVNEENLPVYKSEACYSEVGHLPTFHGLSVEITHRDDNPIPEEFVRVGEKLMRDLCDFLIRHY